MRAMAERGGVHCVKCPSLSFSFTYDDLHKCLYHRTQAALASLPGNLTNSDKHNGKYTERLAR